jgi:predicted RNA binding protein YcfA (HicA-like mRNA interferase family)
MLPKELTGKEQSKLLRQFGYGDVRQNGSHVRIQTNEKGKSSESILNNNSLKAGTLRQIL